MNRTIGQNGTYHFGRLLSEILQKKNMKQNELSRLSGVSEPHISQILSDKRKPDIATLEVLCNALNVDVGYFLMKYLMEHKLPDENHRKFVQNHILPALDELNKIIYQEEKF